MAAFRIFYAWQSDRPAKLCRSLIRDALDAAAKQVGEGLDIQDAQRPINVVIDQDTQGEAGSPSVAEMILQKIRESDVFVGDLTFTGCRTGKPERPVPNPNVLIEYGYALHALGEKRVVAVFNEDFGNCQDLPFDMSHRRWPIRYRTSDDSGEQSQVARQAGRRKLAEELTTAIKTIVQKEGKRKADFAAADNGPLVDEFPLKGGVHIEHSARQLRFSSGAMILLSLRSARGELSLTNVKASQIAREALMPLASERNRVSGRSPARVPNGAGIVKSPVPGGAVEFASILLCDGSLYGVDCYHVGRHELAGEPRRPIVLVKIVEEILRDGLRNFLDVAKQQLKLTLPLNVGVALEGVKGHLVVIRPLATHIPILVDRIEDRFRIDCYDVDPAEVLKPFFEKIYDEAGMERP